MPRLSADTLLRRAIEPAMQDRLTLADAYSGEGEIALEAATVAKQIQALAGKRFSKLSPDELETARLAFIFAQQWEDSLADALPPSRERRQCEASAKQFREFRLLVWGKTRLEEMTENAGSVDIVQFLDESRDVPNRRLDRDKR